MKQIYRFPMNRVMQLIEHVIGSEKFYHPYFTQWHEPGLFLVGDHGVYLMSNGVPKMPDPKRTDIWFLAYAKGFDPDKDECYYQNKVDVWGGDDGLKFLPIEDVIDEVAEQREQGRRVYTVWFTNEEGDSGPNISSEELKSMNVWDTQLALLLTNPSNVRAMAQRDASLIGVALPGGMRAIPREKWESRLEEAKPHLQPAEIWLCKNVVDIVYGLEQ